MFGLSTNQMRVNNLNLQTYLLIECGKFVPTSVESLYCAPEISGAQF